MSRAEITRISVPSAAQRESDMEPPAVVRVTEGMIPRLLIAVLLVLDHEWLIQEYLLRLRTADVVLFRALTAVSVVPIKARRSV